MNLDSLMPLLKQFGQFVIKARYPIFAVIIVSLFAYTVLKIDAQSSTERDEAVYATKRSEVQRVEFNQDAIDTILRLRNIDVDIDPQFPGNRNNPF